MSQPQSPSLTKRSCDNWQYPFTDNGINDNEIQKSIFFSPPIVFNNEEELTQTEITKKRRALKAKSLSQLQQEYKEFVQLYQSELEKYNERESQRVEIQKEIEELQGEIKVLTEENRIVEEQYNRIKDQN